MKENLCRDGRRIFAEIEEKVALNMTTLTGNTEILEELSSRGSHLVRCPKQDNLRMKGDAVNIRGTETTNISSILDQKEMRAFKIDFTFFIH